MIKAGFNFATGVPCGVQKYIIATLSDHKKIKHLKAARESEAIGIAAGAYLAGKKPIVYMQNSGLLNIINDITSLLLAYKIPVLMLVSWRGTKGEDAPQHFINGRITEPIIKKIDLPYLVLNRDNLSEAAAFAKNQIGKRQSAIILINRHI